MTDVKQYFETYMAHRVGEISNDGLTPRKVIYHPYQEFDNRYLEILAKNNGAPGAMQELGEAAYFDAHDSETAVRWLTQASALGNGEASLILSQICRNEKGNCAEYFDWLKKSAEQGSVYGMYNLSCALYKGREAYGGFGFDKDHAEALRLAEAAMRRAMELIRLMLSGRCASSFQGILERTLNAFAVCATTAADMILKGEGTAPDPARAKALLQEADDFCVFDLGRRIRNIEEMLARI